MIETILKYNFLNNYQAFIVSKLVKVWQEYKF